MKANSKRLRALVRESVRKVLREQFQQRMPNPEFQRLLNAIKGYPFLVEGHTLKSMRNHLYGFNHNITVNFGRTNDDPYGADVRSYNECGDATIGIDCTVWAWDGRMPKIDDINVMPSVEVVYYTREGDVTVNYTFTPDQISQIEQNLWIELGEPANMDQEPPYEYRLRGESVRRGRPINENRLRSIVKNSLRKCIREAVEDTPTLPDDMFQDLLDNCYATVRPDREKFSVDDEVECVGELAGYTFLYTAEGKYDPGYEAPMAFCHDDPAFSDIGDDGSFTCRITPDDTVVACDEDGNETKYVLSQAQIKRLGKVMSKKCGCDGSNFEPTEYEREYDPSDW